MLLVSALRRAASSAPAKPALIIGDRAMGYRELDRRARDIATRLVAAGVAPGDRVALHMLNSFDLAVAYFACFYSGAIAVPVNTRMRAAEIAYVLDHSGVSFYIGQPGLFAEIRDLPARFPDVRQWVADLSGIAVSKRRPAAELPTVSPDQFAAILYTSGTTARPKGVVHTHRSLCSAARGLGFAGDDVVLPLTPMVHIGTLVVLLAGVEVIATVVMFPRFDPEMALDAIARHKGTAVGGMPVMFRALVAAQRARPRDVRSLTTCFASGDAVPLALKSEFAQCFGAPLREGFGSTETGSIMVNWSDLPAQADSFGQARPDVETAVVGADGEPLPVGAVGELAVRSSRNMAGYWNDPAATAAALRDGWVHTGDLVSRDQDGYFRFHGRKKEIIVRGGSNISPQEVEAVLYQHDGVRDAGVIGAPDPTWGERVVAFVSRRPGRTVSAGELTAFVARRLAAYKTPAEVLFLDDLPKSASGKVQRRALRESYYAGTTGRAARS